MTGPQATAVSDLSLVSTRGGRPTAFAIPEGTTTVGRSPDNDIVLDDPSVSLHQIVLLRDGDTVELRDLFAGETWVNEEPRRSGGLEPGDVLVLGEVPLRLLRVAGPTRRPPDAGAAASSEAREPSDPGFPPAPRDAAAERSAPRAEGSAPAPNDDPFEEPVALGGDDDGAEADLFGTGLAEPEPSAPRRAPAQAAPAPRPAPGLPFDWAQPDAPDVSAVGNGRHPATEAAEVPRGGRSLEDWASFAPAPGADPAAHPGTEPVFDPAREGGATARSGRGGRSLEEELRRLRESEARRARTLARVRELSDELAQDHDFEEALERVAVAFLDVFHADRAVTILFEEDGKNPLLTVERSPDGEEDGGGVAQAIVDRCLQVRSVLRIAGDQSPVDGLAAPLLAEGKPLGLLYFERTTRSRDVEPEDVHLMAMLANQTSAVIASAIA